MKETDIEILKKRKLSRREFLQCVGVTLFVTGVALYPTLGYALYTSHELKKEITSEDLSNYMYIEYSNDNDYSYMFVKKENDSYYNLTLNEEDYFIEKEITENINQDNITNCIPANEIFEKHIGLKETYKIDDYKQLYIALNQKENNNIKIKKT